MADVFISYAREDRSRAEQLASAIAEKGWTVWWDRRLQVGKSFSRVIEAELDAARCVLVLWSGSAVESEWVLTEAAEGTRRSILVPARIEDVRIPLEFRRLHTADLTQWRPGVASGEFEDCLSAIGSLVEPSASAPTHAPKAATHEPPPHEPPPQESSPHEPLPPELPVHEPSTTTAVNPPPPEPSPVAEVAPPPRRRPKWLPIDATFTRTLVSVLAVLVGVCVLLVILTLIHSAWQERVRETTAATTTDGGTSSAAMTTTTTTSSSTPPLKHAADRIVDFETTVGIISFRLRPDLESDQIENLLDLGQAGFFNEMRFQRSPNGLIIKGDDRGSPARGLTSERASSRTPHMRGTLSIPHLRGADIRKQQFFICLALSPPPGLDKYFEVIGVLESANMEVIDRIIDALKNGKQPVVIRRVKFR